MSAWAIRPAAVGSVRGASVGLRLAQTRGPSPTKDAKKTDKWWLGFSITYLGIPDRLSSTGNNGLIPVKNRNRTLRRCH